MSISNICSRLKTDYFDSRELNNQDPIDILKKKLFQEVGSIAEKKYGVNSLIVNNLKLKISDSICLTEDESLVLDKIDSIFNKKFNALANDKLRFEQLLVDVKSLYPQFTEDEAIEFVILSLLFEQESIYVWSRGGGGHKSAFQALCKRNIAEGVGKSKNFDMVGDIIPNFIMERGIKAWDNAQKQGDIDKQIELVNNQGLADFFFYPIIFLWAFYTLMKLDEEPANFISTQVLGILPMLRAIFLVNTIKGWNLKLHLHMTDLSTDSAAHFFTPRQKKIILDPMLNQNLVLHATPPADEDYESFFTKHLGTYDPEIIQIETRNPVRFAFENIEHLKNELNKDVIELNLKYQTEIEASHSKIYGWDYNNKKIQYRIHKEDQMGFLMLGSQPTERALLGYINKMGNLSKQETNASHDHYLFLYVQQSQLEAVNQTVNALKEKDMIAENMHIVPFTFQGDEELALMMARADLLVIRSGGISSMELLSLFGGNSPLFGMRPNRQILIHSEGLKNISRRKFRKKERRSIEIQRLILQGKQMIPFLSQAEQKFGKSALEQLKRKIQQREGATALMTLKERKEYLRNHQHPVSFDKTDKKILKYIEKLCMKKFEKDLFFNFKMNKARREKKIQRKMEKSHISREDAIEELLLKTGVPLWEGGNARYVKKKLGAKISNEIFATSSIANFLEIDPVGMG